MEKIKAIDLFSGCGGVSIGLTNAGFEVTCAVEIDKTAAAAYSNYEALKKVNVKQDDICNLSGNEIRIAAGISKDEMYLLAGCPPCQKFSLQNRKNNRNESHIDDVKRLLMEFKRIIQEMFPPFILMENVPGIKSSFGGRILDEFISALENKSGQPEEQYFIIYGVLNAADYGVPQSRKRFVLHGIRKDVYSIMQRNNICFSLPSKTHSRKGENELNPWVSVKEAFAGLPKIQAGERYNDDKIKNHYCAKLSITNLKRIIEIRNHGGNRTGLPEDLVLKCHKNHTGHQDVYGIMNPDLPSPTITGGCLCYSKGRFGHPYENRAISLREAARLQTFPDDYLFGESLTKAAKEIGNAVPIKLVEASAKVILSSIKELEKTIG